MFHTQAARADAGLRLAGAPHPVDHGDRVRRPLQPLAPAESRHATHVAGQARHQGTVCGEQGNCQSLTVPSGFCPNLPFKPNSVPKMFVIS